VNWPLLNTCTPWVGTGGLCDPEAALPGEAASPAERVFPVVVEPAAGVEEAGNSEEAAEVSGLVVVVVGVVAGVVALVALTGVRVALLVAVFRTGIVDRPVLGVEAALGVAGSAVVVFAVEGVAGFA
jgi:hypothetical protein